MYYLFYVESLFEQTVIRKGLWMEKEKLKGSLASKRHFLKENIFFQLIQLIIMILGNYNR